MLLLLKSGLLLVFNFSGLSRNSRVPFERIPLVFNFSSLLLFRAVLLLVLKFWFVSSGLLDVFNFSSLFQNSLVYFERFALNISSSFRAARSLFSILEPLSKFPVSVERFAPCFQILYIVSCEIFWSLLSGLLLVATSLIS